MDSGWNDATSFDNRVLLLFEVLQDLYRVSFSKPPRVVLIVASGIEGSIGSERTLCSRAPP